MDYPVTLERDDNDTILVSFPDFPEAHTFGQDEVDALVRAKDALATVLEAYIKDRRPIPSPSVRPQLDCIAVPALIEAKLRLYDAMRQARVGKAELARRLHWHLPQVDRLLDVRHGSRLDQIEAALATLGKRLRVTIDARPLEQAYRRNALRSVTRSRKATRKIATKTAHQRG